MLKWDEGGLWPPCPLIAELKASRVAGAPLRVIATGKARVGLLVRMDYAESSTALLYG
jgi:hypothetical protein